MKKIASARWIGWNKSKSEVFFKHERSGGWKGATQKRKGLAVTYADIGAFF